MYFFQDGRYRGRDLHPEADRVPEREAARPAAQRDPLPVLQCPPSQGDHTGLRAGPGGHQEG